MKFLFSVRKLVATAQAVYLFNEILSGSYLVDMSVWFGASLSLPAIGANKYVGGCGSFRALANNWGLMYGFVLSHADKVPGARVTIKRAEK